MPTQPTHAGVVVGRRQSIEFVSAHFRINMYCSGDNLADRIHSLRNTIVPFYFQIYFNKYRQTFMQIVCRHLQNSNCYPMKVCSVN